MPAFANLVLTDRAATPVNHTFVPFDHDPKTGVVSWKTEGSVLAARRTFSQSLRISPSGRIRVLQKMVIPIVQTQTINGIDTPVVVRTSYSNHEFVFDSRSTEQERIDHVGMAFSSLDAAKVLSIAMQTVSNIR